MAETRSSYSKVRLRDIAETAGVSVNTVSRALTGKADVSPATRKHVKQIAQQLNYAPNILARSLVQGQTHTVGLIVTDCTNPYYANLIHAVEDVTSRSGFGLLLATSNENSEKERIALFMLRERRVDGLMLTAVDVDAEHVQHLHAQESNTVLLSRRPAGYEGPFVGADNVGGARLAIRHLFGLGHRRIAHVGRLGLASSGRERRLGFLREMRALGLTGARRLINDVPPTSAGGLAAVPWLLSLNPRPTAVFTYNDAQAIGTIKGLREAGVATPGDVSIVGFDDIAMASLVEPTLTTVAQSIERIGELGAQILIDKINGEPRPETSIVLPTKLVTRESTARPSTAHHHSTD